MSKLKKKKMNKQNFTSKILNLIFTLHQSVSWTYEYTYIVRKNRNSNFNILKFSKKLSFRFFAIIFKLAF